MKSNPNLLQVIMPSELVDLLDQEFFHLDRSTIITQAVLEFLLHLQHLKHPQLDSWTSQEQHNLDRMWSYLDERENTSP